MCGICGFTGDLAGWNLEKNTSADAALLSRSSQNTKVKITGHPENEEGRRQVLTNMMNRIIHRGPDGAGQYIDSGISMGFRRLSIIDLKGAGSSPSTARSTTTVSFART